MVAESLCRLEVKFEAILFEVNMVFVCHCAEAIRKFGIEVLYHSPDTRDGNRRLVFELFLSDRFVKVLSFVVPINGCLGNLVDIKTQPERNES